MTEERNGKKMEKVTDQEKPEREEQIDALLRQLTLHEKIGMVHGAGLFRTEGVERLGIPPLKMSDGPMGVRAEIANDKWRKVGTTDDFVTYLPSNSAIASTWNRELARESGRILGEEARGRGKDMILAPGINIKRSPLCGRNFEYASEDPYLTSQVAAELVQGIQESDVSACVKHFAANSQETERLWVDTIVEERALQEIYYPAFREAVRAGALSVMGAYNRLNGEHCCTGRHLLNEVLRGDWGFDGLIVSDWGGVHDTVLAAESELDVEMGVTGDFDNYWMAAELEQKIREGELSEELLDKKVRNILRLMFRLKMMGPEREMRLAGTYNSPEHREGALRTARESVVLLKNEDGALPLPRSLKRIAVIGLNGAAVHADGGGSAEIKALYEISPLMGIKKLLGGNCQVSYAPGYVIPGRRKGAEDSETPKERRAAEEQRAEALRQALALAAESEAVIFIGGLNHDYDVEGADREDMRLPYGQDEVIRALLEERPDTVVVLMGGSPVEMPWLSGARSLVWSYYNGMEGGTALAEVLFGAVNPSGRLAETFPERAGDCPALCVGDFAEKERVEYREGVMVGYRYYDTEKTPVSFCFGHGLSYTEFAYEELRAEISEDGSHCRVRISVKNTGSRRGAETVQLYVAPVSPSVKRPVHELKGFEKIWLEPGETGELEFDLGREAFAYFDEKAGGFVAEKGEYLIQAGASSRDIRLKRKVCVGETRTK